MGWFWFEKKEEHVQAFKCGREAVDGCFPAFSPKKSSNRSDTGSSSHSRWWTDDKTRINKKLLSSALATIRGSQGPISANSST